MGKFLKKHGKRQEIMYCISRTFPHKKREQRRLGQNEGENKGSVNKNNREKI